MNLTVLVKEYVCAECHSPLTLRYDLESVERWEVVCTKDACHRGFNTKATVEIQQEQAAREGARIVRDPVLRKALPWLPRPEEVTAEQAISELFEA